MFSIVGYNFIEDINALDPTPTALNNIKSTQIQNGIFNHYNVTRDTSSTYTTQIPTMWDYLTIMDCNFNGTILAGNIEFSIRDITNLRIKRRIKGTFDWIILYDIPISGVESFNFTRTDYLNQHGVEYEYAFVPMINDTELNYITNSVESQFNGVFICDMESIFKYYAGVEYSGAIRKNPTTVYEPFGSQYPIVVANSALNYTSMNVRGAVITDEDLYNSSLNRINEVKYRNKLLDFMVNKRAKILKDWNGNIWLMVVTGNPNIQYMNQIGMGLASVEFSATEIGDANKAQDLYNSGMIDITTGGL